MLTVYAKHQALKLADLHARRPCVSVCRHTNQTGVPIMRPLWYEFPAKDELFAVDDEFMLGPGLLVKPITHVSSTTFLDLPSWSIVTVPEYQVRQLSAALAVCERSNISEAHNRCQAHVRLCNLESPDSCVVCLQAGATEV